MSSSLMSDSDKIASGWVQNATGQWGEWRHYKIGSSTVDCQASGCNGRVTPNGACWYPIGGGDRNIEPDINLANALAAKKYLEEMGYTVRMARNYTNQNPSITKRLSYCYPNNDTSLDADAELYLCIHSNAGGGRGSAEITLAGAYDQRGITSSYVNDGNLLGKLCNDRIVNETSLTRYGDGTINFEPELIAFCKAPVTCGYLEIGFFDNQSDLAVLRAESDKIGKAIAEGIDDFCKSKM
jgi:N-acetylmuramoyl-L-alanine amidase